MEKRHNEGKVQMATVRFQFRVTVQIMWTASSAGIGVAKFCLRSVMRNSAIAIS